MPKINEKKYENVILYLAKKLNGAIKGKKKLAKLLYFVDFDFYEKYEKYLTGDEYRAQPMGPLPVHMTTVLGKLEKANKIKIGSEEVPGYENEREVYKVVKKPDMSIFTKEELAILDRVAATYGGLTGSQLKDLSHQEAPYIGTDPGKPIMYELALYRGTDFSNLNKYA